MTRSKCSRRRPPSRRPRLEALRSRQLLAADVLEFDAGVFVFDDDAAEVHRYDLTDGTWDAPMELTPNLGAPTAGLVDDDGVYAAFGTAVYRYDAEGQNGVAVFNASADVVALHSDGNLLVVNYTSGGYGRAVTIDKTNNVLVDSHNEYIDHLYDSVLVPEHNRIVGIRTSGSPDDIYFAEYDDQGMFVRKGETPYHGDFTVRAPMFAYPDGSLVLDGSGNTYHTDTMRHAGRLGTRVDDVAFDEQGRPVTLAGDRLTRFSERRLPDASLDLEFTAEHVFIEGDELVLFRPDDAGGTEFSATRLPLSDLAGTEPDPPADPRTFSFEPRVVGVNGDQSVWVWDKDFGDLHLYDPAEDDYVRSIGLIGTPTYVTYSDTLDRIYAGYADGLITSIEVGTGADDTETPFAALPSAPLEIVAAGDYLITEDSSGAWTSISSYDPEGDRVANRDWHYPSRGLTWSAAAGSVYFISTYSPNDLHRIPVNEDGTLGSDDDSPYHGSSLIRGHLTVSPDGTEVAMGSGAVFDAITLSSGKTIPGGANVDVAWTNGRTYSLQHIEGYSIIRAWDGPQYQVGEAKQLDFLVDRIVPVALDGYTPDGDDATMTDELLVIGRDAEGRPKYMVLDARLNETGPLAREVPEVQWTPPTTLAAYDTVTADLLSATSDVAGSFAYSVAAGDRLPVGLNQIDMTFTPDDATAYQTVRSSATVEVFAVDFGGVGSPTTLVDDGARHRVGDLRLGETVDGELDATDGTQSDDDGVVLVGSLMSINAPTTTSLEITVAIGEPSGGGVGSWLDDAGFRFDDEGGFWFEDDGSNVDDAEPPVDAGFVDAWIDWNGDGMWTEGERVADATPVTTGANLLPIDVPAGLNVGEIAMRVRVSSAGGLGVGGLADDGEVEGYFLSVERVGDPIAIRSSGPSVVTTRGVDDRIEYRRDGVLVASYPKAVLNVWDLPTSDGDDVIRVGGGGGSLLVRGDGGDGHDGVVMSGFEQRFDLDMLPDGALKNVEYVDVTGAGSNGLSISADAVRSVTDGNNHLAIGHDGDDDIDWRGDWEMESPTVGDDGVVHRLRSGNVTVSVHNDRPRTNPIAFADANADGRVNVIDALFVLNRLEFSRRSAAGHSYADVNGDGRVSVVDALTVLNNLSFNRSASRRSSTAVGEPIDTRAVDEVHAGFAADDDRDDEPLWARHGG